LLANGFSIHSSSRAFLYGDGVFETIRIRDGLPINLENHILRLLRGASALKMRIPSYFTSDFFDVRIRELCRQSGIDYGGYCRLSIDRMSGGKYKPETNDVQFFIEVYPLSTNNFVLNEKGWEIDVYTELKKQNNFLANFKTKNAHLYVMASIYAQERQLNDVLLCNTQDVLLESSNSNLFLVSDGVLYTTGLDEGCLAGTMRMKIINLAIENTIRIYEAPLMPKNLLEADEVFLTNAIAGITWVSGYRNRRYQNGMAKKLLALLNN